MAQKSSLVLQILFSGIVAGVSGILAFQLFRNLPLVLQYIFTGGFSLVGFLVGANLSPKLTGLTFGQSYQKLRDQRKANNTLQEQESIQLIQEHRIQLEQFAFRIKNDLVRTQVQHIIQIYQSFTLEVQKDPQDARPVKRYLTNYGETTLKILERYLELQALAQETRTEDEQLFIDRIEIALGELQKAATTQLSRLREQNLMDLDIELTLLEKTMQLDGISSVKNEMSGKST